jgi:hypothetical protein
LLVFRSLRGYSWNPRAVPCNASGVAGKARGKNWLQVIKVVSEVSLMVSPVFDFIEISDQVNFIHFSIGKSEWLQVP